ncbi:MAG TPA: hypothetical protein VJ182_01650 [Anaerolineales bacterium]|nr:hypothetical protein [Anaerolineales bacterium]
MSMTVARQVESDSQMAPYALRLVLAAVIVCLVAATLFMRMTVPEVADQ